MTKRRLKDETSEMGLGLELEAANSASFTDTTTEEDELKWQRRAERLKALREYVGYSKQQIASFLGLKLSEVQKIETVGQRVRYDALEQLAHLYGLTVIELLEGEDLPSPLFKPLYPEESTAENMRALAAFGQIRENLLFMNKLLENTILRGAEESATQLQQIAESAAVGSEEFMETMRKYTYDALDPEKEQESAIREEECEMESATQETTQEKVAPVE